MYDFIKKVSYMGLGLASMSKDKIDELADEFAQKEGVSEEEGKKFAQTLMDESKKARQQLEDRVKKVVKRTLEEFDIPSRKEVEQLKQRIKELEQQQQKEKK